MLEILHVPSLAEIASRITEPEPPKSGIALDLWKMYGGQHRTAKEIAMQVFHVPETAFP